MNHFSIDGVEKNLPIQPEQSFSELLTYVRNTVNSDVALVS